MSVKTYDPSQVAIIIGGRIIKSWNTVTVTRDEDGWTFSAGTSGESTRTKNLNKLGMIEIDMPQTSEDNAILSAFEIAGNTLNSSVIDKGGTSVALVPEGTVVKSADSEFAKESGSRVWQIKGDLVGFVVGGN